MLGIDKEGLDARRGVPWVRLNFMPGWLGAPEGLECAKDRSTQACHSERSEESRPDLRSADDAHGL